MATRMAMTMVLATVFGLGVLTGAGLAHLQSVSELRVLNLNHCKIADSSLAYLEGLSELRMLYVKGAGVTKVGEKRLSDAISGLSIYR